MAWVGLNVSDGKNEMLAIEALGARVFILISEKRVTDAVMFARGWWHL